MSNSSEIKERPIRIGYIGKDASEAVWNILKNGIFSIDPEAKSYIVYNNSPLWNIMNKVLNYDLTSVNHQLLAYMETLSEEQKKRMRLDETHSLHTLILTRVVFYTADNITKIINEVKNEIKDTDIDILSSIIWLSSYIYLPVKEIGKALEFDLTNIIELFPQMCYLGCDFHQHPEYLHAKYSFQIVGYNIMHDHENQYAFNQKIISQLPPKCKAELESFYALLFTGGIDEQLQRYIYEMRSERFFESMVEKSKHIYPSDQGNDATINENAFSFSQIFGYRDNIKGIFDVLFSESSRLHNLVLANKYKKSHPNTTLILINIEGVEPEYPFGGAGYYFPYVQNFECTIEFDKFLIDSGILRDPAFINNIYWGTDSDEIESDHIEEYYESRLFQIKLALNNNIRKIKRYLHHMTGPNSVFQIYKEIDFDNICITTRTNNDILNQIYIASKGDMNVLLLGETGTGKSELARIIHNNSERAHNPFLSIDCTSLSETFIQSELFGHEKGAFTGANDKKVGLMELADGGTVFLDEIGELPNTLQARLLDAIQNKRFRRIGGVEYIYSEFRIIAATNKTIKDLLELGHFRTDLYYRIAHLSIEIPPLRDRKNDIARIFRDRLYNNYIGKEYELLQRNLNPHKIILLEGFDETWGESVARALHDFDLRHCRAINKDHRKFVIVSLEVLLQEKNILKKIKNVVDSSNGGTILFKNIYDISFSCQKEILILLKKYIEDTFQDQLIINQPRFIFVCPSIFREEKLLLIDENRKQYNKPIVLPKSRVNYGSQHNKPMENKKSEQKVKKHKVYKGFYFYLIAKSYKAKCSDFNQGFEQNYNKLQIKNEDYTDSTFQKLLYVPDEWQEYIQKLFPEQDGNDFQEMLLEYNWPGNIRELDGVLKYIFTVSRNEKIISIKDLSKKLNPIDLQFSSEKEKNIDSTVPAESVISESSPKPRYEKFIENGDLSKESLNIILDELYKNYYTALRIQSNGSPEKAAQISGMSSKKISNYWRKYGLSKQS